MTATTVLVATPSSINRGRAAKLIASVPGYEVIATASDLSETFNCAEIRVPDFVVLAEEFSHVDEFSVMRALFDALGTRWILLGANSGPVRNGFAQRPGATAALRPCIDLSMTPDQVGVQMQAVQAPSRANGHRATVATPLNSTVVFDKLAVIGSSTGGVDALLTLLSGFPADCPPTAIVQHTGRGFSDSLVQLLERRCKPNVVAAQEGLILRQGMVCVAGGTDGHMTFGTGGQLRCQLRPGAAVSGHVPSIDVLFNSVLPMAPKVVGTILTGMGQDGAAGLLGLHRAGCMTIGQDEATSVVYGMPKAALDRGAVRQQLPIQRIAASILEACTAGSGPAASPDRRDLAR